MTDTAIITIIDQDITTHVRVERAGDPVSIGLRLLETDIALPGSKRDPGRLTALLLATLVCAGTRGAGQKHPVRLIGDPKAAGQAAFDYEVRVSANLVNIKVTEHGKNGQKGGNGNILFEGLVEGYIAALKVPLPESWERRWLAEVISLEQDIYHRIFTATEAQAAKLWALVDALVKAKELKGGTVLPTAAFETRYSVDNLIGQLTDLVGAGAVKRAAATIAAPATKSKPKPKVKAGGSRKPVK